MCNTNFYICEHCGNLVSAIHDSGVPMMCCGKKMTKIEAGTVEASREKHIPVILVQGNLVTVSVGAIEHPMTAEHSILWVYLQTTKGAQRKCLAVGSEPTVTFALTEDEKAVAAYAYCNLHGLWMAEVAKEEPEACKLKIPANKEENFTVCHCNQVTYFDIEKALHENEGISDVLAAFEKVKDTTHCSTGCGGCHDKVMAIISDIMMGHR